MRVENHGYYFQPNKMYKTSVLLIFAILQELPDEKQSDLLLLETVCLQDLLFYTV